MIQNKNSNIPLYKNFKSFLLKNFSHISIGLNAASSAISNPSSFLSRNQKLFVLSDPIIYSLWKPLFLSLPTPILIPSHEHLKNWSSVQKISNFLLKNHCNRSSHLLIIGGGLLCDLGGFTASCFMRGISFSLIPTTLLSMADASIGGKSAINSPSAKNLWGSFALPNHVFIDPSFLQSLPSTFLIQGLSEMIKHALLTDLDHLLDLQRLSLSLPQNNSLHLWLPFITQSCKIKMDFIDNDQLETHDRRIFLNLGHSLAHALETSSKYSSISHGDAVFWGLAFAAYLSTIFSNLPTASWDLIFNIISPLLCPWPNIPISKICSSMAADKKSLHKKIRFILLKNIGHPQIHLLSSQQIFNSLSDFFLKIAKFF